MKTAFDLPDPLLRKAKATAADQGRPLRDLVSEALAEKLAALTLARGAGKSRSGECKAFEAKLQKQTDGSYINPKIPEDTGRMPDWADLFLAATALAHDKVIVTRDVRHFDRIEGRVEI